MKNGNFGSQKGVGCRVYVYKIGIGHLYSSSGEGTPANARANAYARKK